MALGLRTNTIQTGGGTVATGTKVTGFNSSVQDTNTPNGSTRNQTELMYDRGVQQTAAPRVLRAQFGDGYELRMRDGINNTPRTWALSFNNRTKADIDNLYDFMNTLAEIDTAKLTIPSGGSTGGSGNEETVVVVLESYNRVLAYDHFYTLTCSAREVFEA